MGVVNVTPDSFFDGGRYVTNSDALTQVTRLIEAGAELIDIGAESSRPGAPEVPASEQLRRLGTTVQRAAALGAVVSVDTTSPEVATVALGEGAQLINDVSCLRDPGLANVVATYDGWLALMHSRGPMTAMSGFSEWPADDYPDIVSDVARDWGRARQAAVALGVKAEQIVFDPGLGFSKNATHSYALLRELWRFRELGAPILVGPSRKSFIAAADPSPPAERLGGTIAACLIATANGADILRVHDVFEVRQALRVLSAVRRPDLLANPSPSAKGLA
jgi:dihydropteroate synthase